MKLMIKVLEGELEAIRSYTYCIDIYCNICINKLDLLIIAIDIWHVFEL